MARNAAQYNSLAFQFGVGVSTPSWSSRRIYYDSSVQNGEKIERRINAVGGGVSNMSELQQKELEQSPAYIAEQARLAAIAEAARVAEIARLALIEKNDLIALSLWTKLDNQRIVKEKAEIARLAAVKEAQRVAAVKAENLRLELIIQKEESERIAEEQAVIAEINRLQDIEDKEVDRVTKSIPLLTSILPVGILAILLINSSRGKK